MHVGQYLIPSTLKVPEQLPPEKQTFSSYGARFHDVSSCFMISIELIADDIKLQIPRSLQFDTAPGKYNPITSDFDNLKIKLLRKKHNTSKSGWASHIAFEGTESRFFDIAKDDNPGPATYRPKTNIADSIPKQTVRAGPFGTTQKVNSCS